MIVEDAPWSAICHHSQAMYCQPIERGDSRRIRLASPAIVTGTLPTAGQNLALYQTVGNKIKGYELLHFAGIWRVNHNLNINSRIYNLLGKDFTGATPYEWNGDTYYAFDYTQTNAATSGAYLPDRSLWLSMNYEF